MVFPSDSLEHTYRRSPPLLRTDRHSAR